MSKENIDLGDSVRCLVTGFTGTVVVVGAYIDNVRRMSIQPPMKPDGSLPDAYDIDDPQLEWLETKIKAPTFELLPCKFGDEVEDTIRGMKGMVYSLAYHLNGCVKIGLQAKAVANKETGVLEVPKVHWANAHYIRVLKPLKEAVAPRKTGGPEAKIPREW